MTDDIEAMNARIGAYAGHAGRDLPDGTDTFETFQEPRLTPTDDPLAKFVAARILEQELQPRGEVAAVYDEPGGPVAYRYARLMREDCVVFRQIVALYLTELAAADQEVDDGDLPGPFYTRAAALRAAVELIARRWSGHPDFDPHWAWE